MQSDTKPSPDSKVLVANMGLTWVLAAQVGPTLALYKCTPGVRATTPKMTDDAMFLNHRFIFQSPHKVPWRRASTKYGKRKNPWLHNSTFRLKAKNIGSYVTT